MLKELDESLEGELQILCRACRKKHNASAASCPHCGLRRGNQIKPSWKRSLKYTHLLKRGS